MKSCLSLLFIVYVISGRKRKLPQKDDPQFASEWNRAQSFFHPNQGVVRDDNNDLQDLLEPEVNEADEQLESAEILLAQEVPNVVVQPQERSIVVFDVFFNRCPFSNVRSCCCSRDTRSSR